MVPLASSAAPLTVTVEPDTLALQDVIDGAAARATRRLFLNQKSITKAG